VFLRRVVGQESDVMQESVRGERSVGREVRCSIVLNAYDVGHDPGNTHTHVRMLREKMAWGDGGGRELGGKKVMIGREENGDWVTD
jgi:hypothetical protein